MKRMTITVSYEQEKLKALQFYAGKNGTSLESDLDGKTLQEICTIPDQRVH